MYSTIARTVKSLAELLVLILALTVLTAILWESIGHEILLEQDLTDATKEKTALEIQKLRAETSSAEKWVRWFTALVLPLAVAWLAWILNSAASKTAARFTALTQARAQVYASAFKILKPTAIYFPDPTTNRPSTDRVITSETCERMGRELSNWYFGAGGLLMSKPATDAYFDLMFLLWRAADAKKELASQTFEKHRSVRMPRDIVDKYRIDLGIEMKTWQDEDWKCKVRDHKFGDFSKCDGCADYIFIQSLASRLRTRLINDLESRLPPGGQSA